MIRVLPGWGFAPLLEPRGPAAADIAALWWWMLSLLGGAAALTLAVLIVAAVRNRRTDAEPPDPSARGGREARFVVAVGVVLPVAILAAVLARTVLVGARVDRIPGPPAVTVEVTGHMFWWDVRYPEYDVVTANELVVPAGRPVALRLTSADVIHSFWVPELAGKRDMMPGRWETTWLLADAPGTYRGQCAEFCGVQHALMALVVHAVPEADFQAWIAARRAGPTLDDPLVQQGARVFLEAGCDRCHVVRGLTPEGPASSTGPDLTHLATRTTLAAGTMPNVRGNLHGWILDPQSPKPGNRMPSTVLPVADAHALVAFLEALE